MGEWTNEQWIQALNGTPEQREEAAARLWEFLYRSALKMTHGDTVLAEDCAQEAMIRVLAKLDSFRGDSALTTWAYVILRRVYLDALRGRSPGTLAMDPERSDEPGGSQSSSEEHRRAEFWADLRACLAGLSDSQRRAFLKRYVKGLDIDEIRECLTTTAYYVYRLLSQARSLLRTCLTERGWSVHSFV